MKYLERHQRFYRPLWRRRKFCPELQMVDVFLYHLYLCLMMGRSSSVFQTWMRRLSTRKMEEVARRIEVAPRAMDEKMNAEVAR